MRARSRCPVSHLSGFHQPSPPLRPPALCLPVCVLREDRLLLRTGRAWRPGFVYRYQERSAQLSSAQRPEAELRRLSLNRAAPSEEPLAWRHHGHVCLQGSVLRRHRSVQQHQLPRTDETPAVHLQRGYPPHQPVSRRPPAPQSPTQGKITAVQLILHFTCVDMWKFVINGRIWEFESDIFHHKA